MNWEAIGAVGEIVGAIAVVVTIGYLAVQIRQNTRSVLAATHHSSARAATETQNVFAQSNDVARIFRVGSRELEELTGDERQRFHAMLLSIFLWYEDAFFQHQQSMIDREVWEGRQRHLLGQLKLPGITSWWARSSEFFARSFVSYIEQLSQQTMPAEQDEDAEQS
jgi:hypothetical protein